MISKLGVPQAGHKVSRRRLVRDTTLTAGALALASRIDVKYALGQDEGPVKIGWLGDRTGDFSVVGVQKFNAANLAVKELNDADGILGREVVLVPEDAQDELELLQRLAEAVRQEGLALRRQLLDGRPGPLAQARALLHELREDGARFVGLGGSAHGLAGFETADSPPVSNRTRKPLKAG